MAQENIVDNAVAEGGAYEIIRKRLLDQGKQLTELSGQLNKSRLDEFGSSDMEVSARVRVRTENNCIARDIVQVGDHLLFGYNVFIGLKKETKIEDVFALFSLKENDGSYEMEPASIAGSFLSQPSFVNDFEELYRYYKHTKLIQLSIKDSKLLAGFQIGEKIEDIRVFRWSISADGKDIKYIDNRGERDIQLPPAYDFEWHNTSREDIVNGKHAHVNIQDTIFVETTGGDLTIKIENNTQDGLGIYREPVEDKTQSLDDAEFSYAEVGSLILLKVKPYRENDWRHFIYNKQTQEVLRNDAIGQSCIQLPEDHGIIFPGGYYLQTGEFKHFDDEVQGLKFKRAIRSPNGEDVLFVFYEPQEGVVALFAYNLIEKQLQNPIYGHGYALSDSGQLVIFSAENEPTRVHPMQIWATPYVSAEFASNRPVSQTFLGRIGNAELVRGVSDFYSICRLIDNQKVSSRLYEELTRAANKVFDDHYWVAEGETADIGKVIKQISETSELVIDEFEKVESIRQQSTTTMAEAEQKQKDLIRSIQPDSWQKAEEFVGALKQLRFQRGHLVTIKDYRYIDVVRIEKLDVELQEIEANLNEKTVEFLSQEKSLEPYLASIDQLDNKVSEAKSIVEITPLIDDIEEISDGLDLLSELMGSLKVNDANVRTQIIESISQVYAKLNQSKAQAKHRKKELGSAEAIAQFSAQFKLFSQSITNALSSATTPEKCDEQLSRLLVQLEEMESQFGDFDQFLADIMEKRDEVYESFENHKQQLLDERQRKAQSVADAADRILSSIEKRSLKFTEADALNTYFASDALVAKTRDLVEQLRELDSAVKADDIESKFKGIKDQALRSLRDKTDIYEDGGNVIKLGPRHKFSVNTQELDLTIIPRNDELNIHLTGTDFFEPIHHQDLVDSQQFWNMALESETNEVYRAEYLAYQIIESAKSFENGLAPELLNQALLDDKKLDQLVREYAAPKYKEGYEKGIHDHDASLILKSVLPVLNSADLLNYSPLTRGFAQVFWADEKELMGWHELAKSAYQMLEAFNNSQAIDLLVADIEQKMQHFLGANMIDISATQVKQSAKYLAAELSRENLEFITSTYAEELVAELQRSLTDDGWKNYLASLNKLASIPAEQWKLTHAWLEALCVEKRLSKNYIFEAIAILNTGKQLKRRSSSAALDITVKGLLGDHGKINDRTLTFSLDQFLHCMNHHVSEVIPAYHHYLELRQTIIAEEREVLRLDTFKAKPLSSFVRNRLINESYLPLIGDNLAKQMGTVGEDKRTDLMGLLMMISPPGYGKTTLMEYVANRLGLIFMKINCPSLGHDVLSLDPEQAPNATARQELEKLNLGLEMGNNVMLYLDDIQHTHPEFLQKFISLCDATRKIEGVWKGKTKTYDMRGRKFCVVMAGNPYTESGEAFQIPDMLANRADIYNLGDILGGMDEQFALSYIENSMTSNPVLAPLATREMSDTYKLIDMAKGKNVATTDLSHQYSGAEVNEITEILKKMFVVQDVVLKINQQYIASAAQNDKYRTEPVFKLQGSYRNMNKMTEKISSVMNEEELMQMIADHYLGESQLLTTGAEDNLLKLAELRGNMTDEQQERWQQIKSDFMRNKALGGDSSDVGNKVVVQLSDLVSGLNAITQEISQANHQETIIPEPVQQPEKEDKPSKVELHALKALQELNTTLEKMAAPKAPSIEVINQPVPGIDRLLKALADTLEHSIFPLVRSMDKKIDIDLGTHNKMKDISKQLSELQKTLPTSSN